MYQLTYHSLANPDLKLQDLDDILESATTANAVKNISGCLIYYKDSFVQILEGSQEEVLYIYKKIKADARHHTVTLLWENDVNTRFFAEWNMAFYRPDDNDVKFFVNNLLMLSDFSDKTSSSLLSFWATVGKILRDDSPRNHHKIY